MKTLGEGAFAKVKKAKKKDTDEEFAIKCVKLSGLDINDMLSLTNEIDIQGKINHPNVVNLYELYQDDEYIYMVFELMKGGELMDRMTEKDKFVENEARSTMRSVVDAIRYCHSMGIVHRDLKPENLLYESLDEESIIKISDFGFAKFVEGEFVGGLTTVCGTPVYIAPEIIEQKVYGKECDCWSIGVLLYFQLSGKHPFMARDDGNDDKIFELIKKGKYIYDDNFQGVSQEAKSLIDSLLVMDPSKRLNAEQILEHPWFRNH